MSKKASAMMNWIVSGILGFVTGSAFIWFARPTLELWVIGANKLSAKLHAQADAIRAKV